MSLHIGAFLAWLFGCLVGCLVVWLFGCLVVWLVVWLVGCDACKEHHNSKLDVFLREKLKFVLKRECNVF